MRGQVFNLSELIIIVGMCWYFKARFFSSIYNHGSLSGLGCPELQFVSKCTQQNQGNSYSLFCSTSSAYAPTGFADACIVLDGFV